MGTAKAASGGKDKVFASAKAALDAAVAQGWGAIVSARSGESEDVAIAHLSTGWDAGSC